MATEKDETFTILVKGKPLSNVKAHLIHAFLSVRFYDFLKFTLKTNIFIILDDGAFAQCDLTNVL